MFSTVKQDRRHHYSADLLFSDRFSTEIQRLRRAFFATKEALPKQARIHLDSFYRDRLSRAKGRPLLGEALPWLFGDFFGVTEHEHFPVVARAWMNINYSIVMADDAIDRPNSDVAGLTLTSLLLLQRGLSELFAISQNRTKLKSICDNAFSRCASAAYAELDLRKNNSTPGVRLSLRVVERKFAIAEVCFLVLSELNKSSPVSRRVRHVRDFHRKLILGLQMLDDLSDWSEDLENNHFTYLLAHGIRHSAFWRSQIALEKPINLDLSFILLVQTGAITDTLAIARKALSEAMALVTTTPPTGSPLLIEAITNADRLIKAASNSSKSLRKKITRQFPEDRPLKFTAREVIEKANAQDEYLQLKKNLIVISQHS